MTRAVLLLAIPFTGGCQIWPKTSTESSKMGWDHSNIYNARSPYAKLLVEIDAVEGQGPTSRELRELEAFLRQHCDKPAGITIKVDDAIPKAAVSGRSAESLAIEYLNGPADPESAFLYILFYNTKLRGKKAVTDNPAFTPSPHPIIWIDRSYRMVGNVYGSTFSRAVLLHETGHALGLCATTNHHGHEGHCTNPGCLMHTSIRFSISRFLTLRNPWMNTSLCGDCSQELARNRQLAAMDKFDFWHGYFRRKEAGYQVIGVPGLTYVHFGRPPAAPSEELMQSHRKAIADMVRGEHSGLTTVESFNPWEHLAALTHFSREKDPAVRKLATALFDEVFSKLEDAAETEPDGVLESLSDEFIAAAEALPEQHAKLSSLREELYAPPGYGARISKLPQASTRAAGSGSENTN